MQQCLLLLSIRVTFSLQAFRSADLRHVSWAGIQVTFSLQAFRSADLRHVSWAGILEADIQAELS